MAEEMSPPSTRPPCAISFLEALDEDSTPLQKRSLDIAMALAQQKQSRNCAECLGKVGINICPLLIYPSPTARLIKIIREDRIAEVQIRRGLSGEASTEAPGPLLKRTLKILGLPIPPELSTDEPKGDIPQFSSPDTRLEGAKEPRPPCAQELAKFFIQRREAIDEWGRNNLRLPRGEKEPIGPYHRVNEATYLRATQLAKNTAPRYCEACLGADCPLRNKVPPKTLFDSTSKKSKVEIGTQGNEAQITEIRTSRHIISILRGESRQTIPPEVLAKIDDKLAKRVRDKGGTYQEEVA